MKDRAIPVAPVTNQVSRKEDIANCAHRKARAEGVQNVRSSTMAKVVESEKETRDSGRQVQQTGSPLRVQKSATGQGQACQENKVAVRRQELRLLASSILHFPQKRKMQIRYDHIGKDDRPPSPRRRHKADKKEGFAHDREKQSRRKLSAGSPNGENPCFEKPSAPNGNWTH